MSTVLLASEDKHPAVPSSSPATDAANERGVSALFSWGDVDGDGRLDLAAVNGQGALQLLSNAGGGRFEDVTERVGLSQVGNAALALWADYDGDGRLDLFVGAREGESRLFHNEGRVFVDTTRSSGFSSGGAVQSARWLDHDGDGRLDLFVVTAEKSELFRAVEGGSFEVADLTLAGAGIAPAPIDVPGNVDEPGRPPASGSSSGRDVDRGGSSIGGMTVGARPTASGAIPFGPPTPAGCAESINDQANLGTCMSASTTPTLGMLYPISSNLFVATGGDVGIGTTTPVAKLEVAGTARITDTLTLNPSGDQALDVSTGSLYKGGALFIHTKGGVSNTGLGEQALASVTTGYENTALGARALTSNTTGGGNTATGNQTLNANTIGDVNTAFGHLALRANTTGFRNTASGAGALESNTTGDQNTASGTLALGLNTTGDWNTAIGDDALRVNTSGTGNTAIGINSLYQTQTSHNSTATGTHALFWSTGGGNTATGARALYFDTTGSFNTAIGHDALLNNTIGAGNVAVGGGAGMNLTTGSNNIAIGHAGVAAEANTTRIGTAQTRAFHAGVRGVTTANANAVAVLIDSAGQLGTVSSSRRFKKDIADMGDATQRLLELRPVVFRYKQEQTLPGGQEVPPEYGLIAEEVAEIFPDLVVHDEEGLPFTVKYHLLSSMLLNELKKVHERVEALDRANRRDLDELRSRLAAVEARSVPATRPTTTPADSR